MEEPDGTCPEYTKEIKIKMNSRCFRYKDNKNFFVGTFRTGNYVVPPGRAGVRAMTVAGWVS